MTLNTDKMRIYLPPPNSLMPNSSSMDDNTLAIMQKRFDNARRDNNYKVMRDLHRLGAEYRIRRQWEDALLFGDMFVTNMFNNPKYYGIGSIQIANCHLEIGNVYDARKYYKQAHNKAKKSEETELASIACIGLALTHVHIALFLRKYHTATDFHSALTYAVKALQTAQKIVKSRPDLKADALYTLGCVYLIRHDFLNARSLFDEAQKIHKQRSDSENANIEMGIGYTYYGLRVFDEAERWFKRALAKTRDRNPLQSIHALGAVGICQWKQNEYDRAHGSFTEYAALVAKNFPEDPILTDRAKQYRSTLEAMQQTYLSLKNDVSANELGAAEVDGDYSTQIRILTRNIELSEELADFEAQENYAKKLVNVYKNCDNKLELCRAYRTLGTARLRLSCGTLTTTVPQITAERHREKKKLAIEAFLDQQKLFSELQSSSSLTLNELTLMEAESYIDIATAYQRTGMSGEEVQSRCTQALDMLKGITGNEERVKTLKIRANDLMLYTYLTPDHDRQMDVYEATQSILANTGRIKDLKKEIKTLSKQFNEIEIPDSRTLLGSLGLLLEDHNDLSDPDEDYADLGVNNDSQQTGFDDVLAVRSVDNNNNNSNKKKRRAIANTSNNNDDETNSNSDDNNNNSSIARTDSHKRRRTVGSARSPIIVDDDNYGANLGTGIVLSDSELRLLPLRVQRWWQDRLKWLKSEEDRLKQKEALLNSSMQAREEALAKREAAVKRKEEELEAQQNRMAFEDRVQRTLASSTMAITVSPGPQQGTNSPSRTPHQFRPHQPQPQSQSQPQHSKSPQQPRQQQSAVRILGRKQ